MKKFKLLTSVIALLSAMALIGCSSPTGGGSNSTPSQGGGGSGSETTSSPDGTYKVVKVNGVSSTTDMQMVIKNNKIKINAGMEVTITEDGKLLYLGQPYGSWKKNGEQIEIKLGTAGAETTYTIEKITDPKPDPDQGGGTTPDQGDQIKPTDCVGTWKDANGTTITVNADGISGTMPNLTTGEGTINFTVENNKIMADGKQVGTLKSVKGNTMIVIIPSVSKDDMTFNRVSNPDQGGGSVTDSIDGTYYPNYLKIGNEVVPADQFAQLIVKNNEFPISDTINIKIQGNELYNETEKVGTWIKEGKIYKVNFTIIDVNNSNPIIYEIVLKKISDSTTPEQGGDVTPPDTKPSDIQGIWINNTIGNSITVKEDGKSGTMPNPKDHGQTTVTFTIVNNDIMIDTEKFGTVLSLENNMLTVNLPNIGNVSGIHVYTREEENKQPIPENIAPANCVGKWKNAAYNITLTVDKSGKQGNMTYPDGTGSKEVPFTIEGNQINVDNKKFGTVISVKDGKMYAKTLVPSAPIEAKLTSVFYFAKQILR